MGALEKKIPSVAAATKGDQDNISRNQNTADAATDAIPLQGDILEAIGFLKRHTCGWPESWYLQLVAIEPIPTEGQKSKITAITILPAEIDTLAPWFMKYNLDQEWGVYFAVNPLRHRKDLKATKGDIAALAYHHADLDPSEGKPLQEERERHFKAIDEFKCAPSTLIDSGGGYGAFWRLAEPTVHDGNTDALEAVNRRLARHFGADHCHNLDRVMRLPGTINFPNRKKLGKGRVPALARLIYQNDLTYTPEDFSFLPQVEAAAKQAEAADLGNEDVPERFPIHLQSNRKLRARWEGDTTDLKDTSRSGMDMSLAGLLVLLGYRNEEIAAILRVFPYGKGVEASEKYLAHTIGKARGSQQSAADGEPITLELPDITAIPIQEADVSVSFPKPFRGHMEAAVSAALAVAPKPQPELTTLAILIAMSSCCGGYYALPGGGRLNLYGCGIAATGAGKDAPLKLATQVALQARVRLLGKPASGQGLEDALVDFAGTFIEIDEIAHFFSAVDASRAPSYLIEIAANLLRLFSASNGLYRARVRADAKVPRTVRNPAVNLLGFATPEKLGAAVSVDNIVDGLLGRFLFVLAENDPVPRLVRDRLVLPEAVKGTALQVGLARARLLVQGEVPVSIDTTADLALQVALLDADKRGRAASSPFAKALEQRSFEKIERIAGVLAVWDNPASPVVITEHVAWAAAAVRASDMAVLRFTKDFMHGGQVQADAQLLKKLIRRVIANEFTTARAREAAVVKEGWAPRRMLLRASKFDTKRMDNAVAQLIDLGDIEVEVFKTTHANGREEKLYALQLTEGA